MPIYMDRHIAPGVSARELAEAHILDVKVQHNYGCQAMTYWFDQDKGNAFCLIEAPDKESVSKMHESAHGLIPNEIILVNPDIVKAFLGRIQDPSIVAIQAETDLKIFSDPAFRVLLVTRTIDPRLLKFRLGYERTQELLLLYSTVIRDQARIHDGREVYLNDDGFVISFTSTTHAMACALAVQKTLQNCSSLIGLRFGLHGGFPVAKSETIFGSTIAFAGFLCDIAKDGQIFISHTVRSLYKENDFILAVGKDKIRSLGAAEEPFVETLLDTFGSHWRDHDFDVPDFCKAMSMSKPQLYRKCITVVGMSPNSLLREYRLLQSLHYLRKEDRNISETTFDTGFTSPSYFTKCFLKRFGIQPLAYMKSK